MDVNEIIGTNLLNLRSQQHISLGQLSERTGLSKAVLSQIEKGSANPTINTIWKLSAALHVPYSALLEPQERPVRVITRNEVLMQSDDDGMYQIGCYYPSTQERHFEWFLLELKPGARHETQGHTELSEEYVLVRTGSLCLEIDGTTYTLQEEDSLSFDASKRHVYTNPGNITVQIYCINYYKRF